MSLPIFDNHLHLRPDGRGLGALREFAAAGGTHAILSHLPYDEVFIDSERDFRRSFQITLDMAEKANRLTDVRLWVTLGPYPVLLLPLMERHGLKRAVEIMRGGMEIAADLVEAGEAVAIGEIGRPHFQVDEEVLTVSNSIMEYGMKLASEQGCPVVLHTESSNPEVMAELGIMADRAGLERGKVVKHYCPPLVLESENHGLFPSVLASRPSLREAVEKGTRFMMETDYLDDPERPGAVMSPATIPKRMRWLLQEGLLEEEEAMTIHAENPERVYGIEIS